MRKAALPAAAAILVVAAIWGASPWYAAERLREAVASGDSAAIRERVDFAAVRSNMVAQLADDPLGALSGLVASGLADRAMGAAVSADGLASVLGSQPEDFDYRAGYLSPDRFRVDLGDRASGAPGPALVFERRGFARWVVVAIELPVSGRRGGPLPPG